MTARTASQSAFDYPSRNPLRTLAGLGLCLLAFYLMLCLMTYHQADPSLNRAANNDVMNAGGYSGAILADLTLQLLGLSGVLAVLVPVAWGVKLLRGMTISYLWMRFSLLLVS